MAGGPLTGYWTCAPGPSVRTALAELCTAAAGPGDDGAISCRSIFVWFVRDCYRRAQVSPATRVFPSTTNWPELVVTEYMGFVRSVWLTATIFHSLRKAAVRNRARFSGTKKNSASSVEADMPIENHSASPNVDCDRRVPMLVDTASPARGAERWSHSSDSLAADASTATGARGSTCPSAANHPATNPRK